MTDLKFEYRCPKCGHNHFKMQPDNEAKHRGRKMAEAIVRNDATTLFRLALEAYKNVTYTCSNCGQQICGDSRPPLKLKKVR